ncbi:MAG: cell division protein ZapA [Desulfobacca sp.]|uniref:cell division protein ZapA n=1 Tax=Desulfobacca sp. TaxID=2067990 RepID=UPI004049D94B
MITQTGSAGFREIGEHSISTSVTKKIEILGRPFTLRCNTSPQHLEDVIYLVQEKIRETRKALPKAANEEIAILAALNLAFDYLELKEEFQHLQREIEVRSKNLIQLLEIKSSLPLR